MGRTLQAIFTLVIAAIVLAGISSALRGLMALSSEETGVATYENDAYAVRFNYPESLYLKEVDAGEAGRPQLALILVEHTQENRAVLEGRVAEPREGPPGITVDVYANPARLGAGEWVRQDTNWTVATSSSTPTQVAGEQGVTFGWSGLYEGRSVVVTKGDRAYVLAVTWLDADDQIVRDFQMVLDSLALK